MESVKDVLPPTPLNYENIEVCIFLNLASFNRKSFWGNSANKFGLNLTYC